jgi:hypothetical protein
MSRKRARILEWAAEYAQARGFHTRDCARRFGPGAWIWLPRLTEDGYLIQTAPHVYITATSF